MLESIQRNDARFVRELLDRGLPMDPLYASEAVKVRGKDILEVFLQHGWDINQPVSELRPPILGYAVEDEEMVSWLLDHGADPNRQCVIDLTPFSFAVETASISVIRLIISHGGDVQKGQVLHHALERQVDIIEVLQILLDNRAPINAIIYEKHYPSRALFEFMGLGTALHKAYALGQDEVVEYLISQGADRYIRDTKGRTAIECAPTSHTK